MIGFCKLGIEHPFFCSTKDHRWAQYGHFIGCTYLIRYNSNSLTWIAISYYKIDCMINHSFGYHDAWHTFKPFFVLFISANLLMGATH